MRDAAKKSEQSAIEAMRNMNKVQKVGPQENVATSRKRYSLKIKTAAVEDVKSSRKPAARVAAEHGVPAQTLSNWVRADRGGSLGELVRLNVSEMEFIMKYCLTARAGDSPVPETPAEQKALTNLKRKINSALNRAKRTPKS